MKTSGLQFMIEALYILYTENKSNQSPIFLENMEKFFSWLKNYGFDEKLLDTGETGFKNYSDNIAAVSSKILSDTGLKDDITEVVSFILSSCYESIGPFTKVSTNLNAYFISKYSKEIEDCFNTNKTMLKNMDIVGKNSVNVDDVIQNFQKIMEVLKEFGKVMIFLEVKDKQFEDKIKEAEKKVDEIKKQLKHRYQTSDGSQNFKRQKFNKKKVMIIVGIILIALSVLATIAYLLWTKEITFPWIKQK